MQGRRLELSHLKGSTMKRLSAPGSGDHGAPDTVMKSTNPSPRALASHGLSSRATVWVHLIHQLWAAPLWKISQSVVAFLWHATKVIIRHSTVFSFSLNYPVFFCCLKPKTRKGCNSSIHNRKLGIPLYSMHLPLNAPSHSQQNQKLFWKF